MPIRSHSLISKPSPSIPLAAFDALVLVIIVFVKVQVQESLSSISETIKNSTAP